MLLSAWLNSLCFGGWFDWLNPHGTPCLLFLAMSWCFKHSTFQASCFSVHSLYPLCSSQLWCSPPCFYTCHIFTSSSFSYILLSLREEKSWAVAVKGAVWLWQCYWECCHTVPYHAQKTAGFLFCLSKRSIQAQPGSSAFQSTSLLMCWSAVIAVTVPRAVISDKASIELAQRKALQTQVAWMSGSQHNFALQLCWAQSPHIGIGWTICRHRSRHSAGRAYACLRRLL